MTQRRGALAEAICQFNRWRFWECHETLEEVWRAEGSGLAAFYQGIIKLSAGFHHLLRSNHRGAVSLLSGGLALLEPFRPTCLQVDVQRLVGEARLCLNLLCELGPQGLPRFDRSLIPRIHLRPEGEIEP